MPGEGRVGEKNCQSAMDTASTASAAMPETAARRTRRALRGAGVTGEIAVPDVVDIQRSSSAASAAVCQRASGSLARHRERSDQARAASAVGARGSDGVP